MLLLFWSRPHGNSGNSQQSINNIGEYSLCSVFSYIMLLQLSQLMYLSANKPARARKMHFTNDYVTED